MPQAILVQPTIAANGSTQPINATDMGFGSIAVQLGGGFGGGTVTFQCSIDGVTYFSCAMYSSDQAPSTVVTTAVAAGIFRTVDATGLGYFRCTLAGATSPTLTVQQLVNALNG